MTISKFMYDLMAVAFQADITRVATLMLAAISPSSNLPHMAGYWAVHGSSPPTATFQRTKPTMQR